MFPYARLIKFCEAMVLRRTGVQDCKKGYAIRPLAGSLRGLLPLTPMAHTLHHTLITTINYRGVGKVRYAENNLHWFLKSNFNYSFEINNVIYHRNGGDFSPAGGSLFCRGFCLLPGAWV
ncbi:MAG: hypothetical protein ABI921_03575 [Panacibacter sp.]